MKIFYFILILTCISKGEILFFDLNDNPKEIEAARRAAKKRNESLIVYPSISVTDKREIDKTKTEFHNARSVYRECLNTNIVGCAELKTKYQSARSIYDSTREKFKLNASKLNKIMESLKNSNTKISSVVISGHDGNGYFTGSNGDLNDRDLHSAFSKNAPVGDGVRSLLLWGCYTANIGSLLGHWKKALPQAELIAGFDASAPLGNKPANWAYLEDVLVKEKKLTSIKDSSELQRILRQLNGASQMYSSICVRDSYADLKKSLSLSQATKLCKGMQEEAAAIFKCYLHAERSKCENPPENTSNSELRSLYNKLQDGKHCREVFEGQGVSFPDPEKVLRLIFFKNVKNNFSNNAKDQITYFNELIEKIGAPENLKWTDIDKMSRADIIDKLNAINQFLTSSVKESGPFFPEIVSLNIGYNVFQSMLADLNVDFPWVEPDLHDNSTIDLEFQKFTSEDMVSRREVYEFNRAEGAVYQELEKSIEATEWGKSLSQIEQDLKKQFELFYFNPHDEDAYTAYRNRTSELQKQRVKLLKENLPKSNITYDKIIERLKVEPYPNSEAKKIFDDKLESISKKDPTAFLIEYYGKQDLLSQKGGFGFGMGIGASAR